MGWKDNKEGVTVDCTPLGVQKNLKLRYIKSHGYTRYPQSNVEWLYQEDVTHQPMSKDILASIIKQTHTQNIFIFNTYIVFRVLNLLKNELFFLGGTAINYNHWGTDSFSEERRTHFMMLYYFEQLLQNFRGEAAQSIWTQAKSREQYYYSIIYEHNYKDLKVVEHDWNYMNILNFKLSKCRILKVIIYFI